MRSFKLYGTNILNKVTSGIFFSDDLTPRPPPLAGARIQRWGDKMILCRIFSILKSLNLTFEKALKIAFFGMVEPLYGSTIPKKVSISRPGKGEKFLFCWIQGKYFESNFNAVNNNSLNRCRIFKENPATGTVVSRRRLTTVPVFLFPLPGGEGIKG